VLGALHVVWLETGGVQAAFDGAAQVEVATAVATRESRRQAAVSAAESGDHVVSHFVAARTGTG
jgi:hypothetical protein